MFVCLFFAHIAHEALCFINNKHINQSINQKQIINKGQRERERTPRRERKREREREREGERERDRERERERENTPNR